MQVDGQSQNTLRETLEANITASENGTLGQPNDALPVDQNIDTANETAEQKEQRLRDEQGRFAAKTKEDGVPPLDGAAPAITPVDAVPVVGVQRPTTWKKEYLPIWDKLATGQPLTAEEARKLAEYSGQREKEFATGVSTYKAEAQSARELQNALEPVMPTLQQYNLKPADWIRDVSHVHKTLALGTPEQKIDMLGQLAKAYGIPVNAIVAQQSGQLDPMVPQLMQYIQQLEGKVNTVTSWRDQQEQQAINQEISKFADAEKYPHFEQVRGTMAQLLESGLAQDLEKAYAKAIRMDDGAWAAEQERQAQVAAAAAQAASQKNAVAKAKAAAISPRSTTPSGTATNSTATDRRAMLSAGLDAATGGRV